MKGARAAVVLAIVLANAVAPAAAQTAASSFTDLQGRLRGDQTVYVQTAEIADESGRGVKGKVLELSGSTLRLLVNGQRREYSERDVLVVSERHNHVWKGALIGLAVGTALDLSLLHGWALARGCGQGDAESCGWAKLGLTVMGAGGVLIGAGIGRSIEHERVLFLAPDLKQSHSFTITPFVGSSRKGLAATFRF
jgi:hypothetical protein